MNKRWLLVPLAMTVVSPALALTASPAGLVLNPNPNPTPIPVATSTGPTVAQWQALYSSTSPTTSFRIPADMPVAAPLVPGQLVMAKYAPFTGSIALTKNNAYGLLSSLLANAVSAERLGPAVTPVANTTPMYPQYEGDGYTINSCDEYVYKRYYDYRRFQDAAATCGGSPDCVYNLWASTAVPGEAFNMLPKSGIAWFMSPYPTSTLDPVPFQPTQTGTTQQLKNPLRDPTAVSQLELGLQFAMGNTSGPTPYGTVLGYLESSAFTSSSPYYTITGARMPWHKQMHAQQATYGETMADRAAIQQRIANIQSLLGAFNAAYANDMAAYEFWEAAVERTCGGIVQAPPGLHPCTPQNPSACNTPPPPSPACIQVRGEDPGMPRSMVAGLALGNALVAEFNHVDRVSGQVDNGCLGVNHNKCDWSPTMIGQEYLTTLDSQAAADLSLCDSFFGTAPVSSLNAQNPNATSDEADFALALVNASGAAKLARESLSWSQSAPDTIRYDLFGGPQSWSIGGSVASAYYNQQAYWEVKGEKGPTGASNAGTLCRLSGRIYGAATAGGTVFGQGFTLLDADVQAGVGETVSSTAGASDENGYSYESHLTIAGDSLYSVSGASTGNFSDPIGNYNYTDTVLDVPGQISWLSLDLKVNVSANVNATLSGTVPPPCAQVTDPTKLQYSLGANVTPSVSAAAVGTALVGALGTGVGVQGTVDVLTVSLPITLTTNVGVGTDNNVDVLLDANASLDLNVLSGELDTAECVLGDCATQQLYAWSGIPAFNDVLWNTTDQFPVIIMQNAFQ